MTAPEDRPDSPDVLDPNGNARLLGLSPRVVGDPARFADIYDKSGTFGVAWTVRGLAARLAAAEARIEAVNAWLAKAEPYPELNGNKFAEVRAALSVHPNPNQRQSGDLARVLAKHQLAYVLPGGVACTCGAELAALNPPLDDGSIHGEGLALAVHQLQEMEQAAVHEFDLNPT